jgi:hypothetical protein
LFHVAGCEYIHEKDKLRTLPAAEAEGEGYVPCVRCMKKYLVASTRLRSSDDEGRESADRSASWGDPTQV